MINKGLMSSNTPEWATPQELFNELDGKYGPFTLDPCATKENAKCRRFYTKEDDGLSKSWEDENVFMNPPYGNSRPLFPLESLKRTHFLIDIFSKKGNFRENPLSFSNGINIITHVSDGQNGFGVLDNKEGQNQFKNSNSVIPIDNPLPSDAFIILSRLLTNHFSESERACQEFNRRFMNHFNLEIKTIDKTSSSRLAFSSRFSLMDAYTAFAINNPSTPSQYIFIHKVIIPAVRGYIKWCMSAIPGIGEWVKKAAETEGRGKVVALLPARTDTRWFHDYIYEKPNVTIHFIKGRVKFGDGKNSAPFPSMVVIFRPLKA